MSFEQLWDIIENKDVVIYATLKNDNILRGPLGSDKPLLKNNILRNSKYIEFANLTGDTKIFMAPRLMIIIDEKDVISILEEDDCILIDCVKAKYKIIVNK